MTTEREQFEAWAKKEGIGSGHWNAGRIIARAAWQAGRASAVPSAKPVAWGMRDKETGEIMDSICPAEHDREPGSYTVPLYEGLAVPDGYVLVPVEPTQRMIEAAFDAASSGVSEGNIRARYRAMLAAAPSKEGQ